MNCTSSADFSLSILKQRAEDGSLLDEFLEFAMWGPVGLMVGWFAWTLLAGLVERLFLFDSSPIGQLLNVGSVAVLPAVLASIILFGIARPIALAVAAQIQGHAVPALRRQRSGGCAPSRARLAAAVRQQDGWVTRIAPGIGH